MTPPATFPRRRALRILIVDDNLDNLVLTAELLRTRGYDALTASSAEAAQEMIDRDPPDLVLLDVIFPGRSGYELCPELKDDPATRLIPVVIITALSQREVSLTRQQLLVMQQRPVTGENICRPLKSLRMVLPIIRHDHEHMNGSGYPDGLRGEDIPLLARILQVGDVYDALRTQRPYKQAISFDLTRSEMLHEANAGLLDLMLVNAFFSMLDSSQQAA